MSESPTPKTPPHRRLIPTDVPGVYRRGSRFVAITQSRGKRTKTYHRTKAEARRAKAERQLRAAPPHSREPFDEYVERWLVEYRGRTAAGVSPSTMEAYAPLLRNYAVPHFGRKAIGDIGPLDLRNFAAHLLDVAPLRPVRGSTRLSASTIRRIMCPLKAMLAEAYELELTRVNAARVRLVLPGAPQRVEPRTLSRAELGAVLAELGEPDRRLFWTLSLTGLRISEALGLQWRDVERTAAPVLHVRRQCRSGVLREELKTPASRRVVAVVPVLYAALLDWEPSSAATAPVFPSAAGTHQDAHNVRRRLRCATDGAGVPWATPHTFRHTFASDLFARGYDAAVVATILGHRSEAFTRRTYIHVAEVPRFDALVAPVGASDAPSDQRRNVRSGSAAPASVGSCRYSDRGREPLALSPTIFSELDDSVR
jgi:integrase